MLDDLLDGYVSVEGVLRDYGVRIDPEAVTVAAVSETDKEGNDSRLTSKLPSGRTTRLSKRSVYAIRPENRVNRMQ